jgi:hypothetical protein
VDVHIHELARVAS